MQTNRKELMGSLAAITSAYNGPQNQDHIFSKYRERGMIHCTVKSSNPALMSALPPSSVELHRGKWLPMWFVSQEKEYSSPR